MSSISVTTVAEIVGPQRGRPASTTRDAVLGAALELVDREGLAALTMRELARALKVSVGTVYATAGSKEDILEGIADRVFADLPQIDVESDDWRGALIEFFQDVHRQMSQHPSVAQLAVVRPLLGPSAQASHAAIFALLDHAGFTDADAATLYTTLASYTTGFVLYQIARRRPAERRGNGRPDIPVRVGSLSLSDEQFHEGLRNLIHNFR